MAITTRQAARENKHTHYFTGKPCRREAHISKRFTSNGKCMQCSREDSLKRARSNPEQNRMRVRAWQKANPTRHAAKTTAHYRKKKYGVEPEQLNAMLEAQNNSCAICIQPFLKTPNVDHCHAHGHVRGILCGPCNRGLGMFEDNPQRLLAAANYLQERLAPK